MENKNRLLRSIILFTAAVVFICLISLSAFSERSEQAAHASEPEQTYDIRSAQDMIDYSKAYAAGDRNPKDVLNITVNTGSVVTSDGFISLGTSARPFAGTIKAPNAGVGTFLLCNCPLFNYVSTDTVITGSGEIVIMREKANETPDVGVLTTGALFANHVVKGSNAASWNVTLQPYDAEKLNGEAATNFPGVIGDIADECVVTIRFNDTSALPVVGTEHTGLICGTLGESAVLNVSTEGSGSARALSTSSGDAGSLVGKMKAGSTLKFNSSNNTRVNSVTTSSGYAGGLVGYAEDVTVQYGKDKLNSDVTDYAVSGTITGTTGAGGLYGYYKNTASSFDLTKFTLASGITISSSASSGSTGGIFGYLENRANSFTFDGNASGSEVFSVTLSNGKRRGGICGQFKTKALTDVVTITNTALTVGTSVSDYSGGLIGVITNDPAYVSIVGSTGAAYNAVPSISVTISGSVNGGLIGSIGSGGSFIDVSGDIKIDGIADAGLIANMPHGVLRIQGSTYLDAFVKKDSDSGTIVKYRDRALIYALGDGAGTTGAEEGSWKLIRNVNNAIDDVHSWGQVIRVNNGSTLSESDLFTVDTTNHTVTVLGAKTTINTVTDFALTALNIKLNTGAGVGALRFTSGNANLSATLLGSTGKLTLGADISLASTGLLGLTRDDGKNNSFAGTLYTGESSSTVHTVTLSTGEPYGKRINAGIESALDNNTKQGNVYEHEFTGLFAKSNGATIENVTVAGNVYIRQKAENIKAGGLVAYATGALTLTNAGATFALSYMTDDLDFYFGGAVGQAANSGLSISVTDCSFMPSVTDKTENGVGSSKVSYIGGAIGAVFAGNTETPSQSIVFDGATVGFTSYQKTINTGRESAFGGAIAYIGSALYTKGNRVVTFKGGSNVVITSATGTTGGKGFGGILGMKWHAVDANINDLTTTSTITATGSATNIGGLVRTGTGGWSIAADPVEGGNGLTVSSASYTLPSGCTFGFVANKTNYTDNSNSALNSALYLSVDQAKFDLSGLSITGAPTVYDELVADSRYNENNITKNGNSVISVTTSSNVVSTENSVYNTYQTQKTAYNTTNGFARYYYNLEYARANASTVAKYNFLVWSVRQYAHSSLSAWFSSSSTFTGSLDMTGLSYYPIDLTSSATFENATLKLDHTLMNDYVKYAYSGSATRTTLSSVSQHYLMHTSVFRDVTGTVTVSGNSGLTLQGNVPWISNASCGFFISGMLGNSDRVNARLAASKIVFEDALIKKSGSILTSSDDYAPLFINNIGKSTTVTINGAEQKATAVAPAEGYKALTGSQYAATSLIGNVGDPAARAIYLSFVKLVFDARRNSSDPNIATMDSTYGTTKSIFSKATLLNSFVYYNESDGSYNFELSDDWEDGEPATPTHKVTYGKEITSSVEYSGRENKYANQKTTSYLVNPTEYQTSSNAYDFSTKFLPYVREPYDPDHVSDEEDDAYCKHELKINITISTTIEGCGKYDDPFVIDSKDKLKAIANIIATNNGTGVDIELPTVHPSSADILELDWTTTGYNKYLYTFGTTDYTSAGHSNLGSATVRKYLAGAYYVITRDIELDDGYVGLGAVNENAATYAFRGVIIGRGNPTVTNTTDKPLIQTAIGCVVQNLTVAVDVDIDSSNVISLAAPGGTDTDIYKFNGGNPAYGAVIGQILGGDNFIDTVQVDFTNATFNLTAASSSKYVRLVPIGGYVGVLVNGGLIFRNMTAENVGLTSSTTALVAENSGYLYVNPIIGRVIAGYAFHETSDSYHPTEGTSVLKNGNKNYTICDLSKAMTGLTVTRSGDHFIINVPNGQAMFLLGAIVNSGASSASYNVSTEQGYNDLKVNSVDYSWSAYRAYTVTRAGSGYSTVGTSSGTDYTAAQNDQYTENGVKVPYIIRQYTNKVGNIYPARAMSSATKNVVNVTGDCEIAAGFRGIGSIYLNNSLVWLGISACRGWDASLNGGSGGVTTRDLIFHMRYLEYNHKSISVYIAYAASGDADNNAAGFGLFNHLAMASPSASNSIQYLDLSGNIFYDVYRLDTGVQAAYNFALYKNSAAWDRPEFLNITSGNTEDAVLRRTILSVGGIAGFVNTQFYIKNVTFDGLNVEGAKTAGGLIGFVYQKGNNISYIAYDENVTNSGFVNVVGGLQAGGLIGRIYCGNVHIDGTSTGTDIIVKNIQSKNSNPDEYGMNYFANLNTGVGGLIGNCWGMDTKGGVSGGSAPSLPSVSTVRHLFIDHINVVKGTNEANVRVLNDSGTKNNYAGGFVGSAHNTWLKIENCKVIGVNIAANTAGGFVGKMSQKYYLYIKNCSTEGVLGENGVKQSTISGTRYAGGAAGWTIGRDTLYFQLLNFTTKDYIVESTITTADMGGAGGVLGYAQGNNKGTKDVSNYICEFNNLTVLNCDIITNYTNKVDNYLKYKCGTGGLIGVIDTINLSDSGLPDESNRTESNKYKFSGYNILVKDTTLTHLSGGDPLAPDNNAFIGNSSANKRIGDIVGNNAVQSPLWFVGVAVQNATYCGKHVGYWNSDLNNYGSGYYASTHSTETAGYVVFANYNESDSNTSFNTSVNDTTSASAATDDYSYVDEGTASYPYVTVNPSFTFGGHTITGDGVADSVADLAINSIITDGTIATAKYSYAAAAYYTGSSGENNLTAFNSHFIGKLAMFTSEVTGYIGTDFPILILDDTNHANSTKMLNSYLRLLTNTTYDFARDNDTIYKIFIYNMSYNNGTFTPTVLGASLKRGDNEFYMTSNTFDSGKLQFSLLDVRFLNPANTDETAYHVYVPVFVKKVLSFEFNIAVESGTTYHPATYASDYGKALIENVGMPVTFYFSYTYQRTATDWENAINAGENVHRNYAKTLQFYKANTYDILATLPSSTVLVLVDPSKGGRPYYSTIGQALAGNTLSLSSFQTGFSRSAGIVTLSGDHFAPTNLEDYLTVTVTPGEGSLVQCEGLEEPTLVVNGQGYRLATEDDSAKTKYTATVAIPGGSTYFTEKYYLSVFTDANAETKQLFHYYLVTSPAAFSELAYPSRISDTGSHTMVHLIMGNIFYHSDFSLSSTSALGEDVVIMTSDNNSLQIDMHAQVGLSDDLNTSIKENVLDLISATEVYHSFVVYLNRKEREEISRVIIGPPAGAGTYNIDYVLNGSADTATTAYGNSAVHITQNYAEFVTPNISNKFTVNDKFEINATLTLTYPSAAITTQFPGRGTLTPDNGVTISGSSNIAFSETSTAYTKNVIPADETPAKSYYSEADPEIAVLSLNPVGDKVGDFTLLGINALNNEGSDTAAFELLAVINVTTSLYEQISSYADASVTITLEKKLQDGSYGEALDISQYITIALEGVQPDPITDSGTSYTAIIPKSMLSDNGVEIILPVFHCVVKTGAALESSGLTYGNYRISCNVSLRDDLGSDYSVSRVSNFVIYTNAKLIPDFIYTE